MRKPTRTPTLVIILVAVVCAGIPAAARPQQSPAPGQNQQPAASAPAVPSCPELAAALNAVVRNDVRLRDWANLNRYRPANAELTAPRAGQSRVVFMGDSITDLWQQPRFGDFFPGKPYIDRGISGQTTAQMLVRFRPDVIALKPRAVVILAGTNDISGNTGPATDEEIEANLASMCDLAKVNGIQVVLASLLPVGAHHHRADDPSAPQTTQRPMARITAVNEWMKGYAKARDCEYLDYFTAMIGADGQLQADLTEDDLHPNAKGYEVMAPLVEAAIARALKR